MKKNILNVTALLCALIFSAFTISNFRIDYIFQYDGSNYTSKASVENPANWDYVSTTPDDLTCDDLNQQACRIKVPPSAVNTSPSITLKSTADIKASAYVGQSTTYYVSGGTSVLAYSNQVQASR